jgi:integrase
MQNDGSNRKRHVPVKGASHIYWSEKASGKVFEVRHPRNAEGKRLYETVGARLDEAKARAREIHGDTTPRVLRVGITLGEVYDSWVAARDIRPASVRSFDGNYTRHIAPRFGRVKVREIDAGAIAAWLGGLKRQDGKEGPLASGTRRLILATFTMILYHGVEIGALSAVPRLPRRRIPRPGEARRRILTPDEEARLLAYCATTPWLAPMITVALHQALRLGEVAGLSWQDVDFVGGKLNVRQSLGRDGKTLGPTKGGRAAVIDLTPLARQALLELRGDSDGTGLVFRNRAGNGRQLRDIQRSFVKARDRAALMETDDGPVVFHSLRHTGISRLANHPSIPLVHVRDFARHADLATTQSYVHRIENETVTAAIAEALAGTVTA